MLSPTIPEIVKLMDAGAMHVSAPRPVLFICGGKADVKSHEILSFRHAFMKLSGQDDLREYNILLAEELDAFFPRGEYKDILNFEQDIAKIADLIILFSESYGSAAELGAFSVTHDIAANLIVFIDSGHYEQNSFIKLGPLRWLERAQGKESVCVLPMNLLGLEKIDKLEDLNVPAFSKMVIDAINVRRVQTRHRTTFDKNNDGHLVKLIVGLIQLYGGLEPLEIEFLLCDLHIVAEAGRIRDFLLCAEFAGWVKLIRAGQREYFCALDMPFALTYKLRKGVAPIDKNRWMSDVREFYKKEDLIRFDCITTTIGSGTK